METNFLGGGTLWYYAGAPDSSVHNSLGGYAEMGDRFFDTANLKFYLCTTGAPDPQVWAEIALMTDVLALINALPQADWNQASSGAADFIKNKPSIPVAASQSSSSRSLNSAFQISTTRGSFAFYSVQIATTISLGGGQSGSVVFEIASDSGFTTNVQSFPQFNNAQSGTLVLGLTLNQTLSGVVGGYVPAGYYARLRTVNTTGTPTFTYLSGQEILV